jgi:hypothetical protein
MLEQAFAVLGLYQFKPSVTEGVGALVPSVHAWLPCSAVESVVWAQIVTLDHQAFLAYRKDKVALRADGLIVRRDTLPSEVPSALPSSQVGAAAVNGTAAGIDPLPHVKDRRCDIDGGGEEGKKGVVKRGHSCSPAELVVAAV